MERGLTSTLAMAALSLVLLSGCDKKFNLTFVNQTGQEREVVLDTTRSSTSPDVCTRESQSRDIALPYGRSVELRVFVDRSVVEVFVAGREYLAKRIYPSHPGDLVVELFAVGGRATARSVDVWRMEAVWPTGG